MTAVLGSLFLGAILVGCETKAAGPPSSSGNAAPPQRVAATGTAAEPPSAPVPVRVEVTSAGFQPTRIDAGSSRAIVFRRTTDKTCATSVVFPALGIEKTLPLNADVAVDLPPEATGELAFQCGMGMDRGKVIVR